MQRREDLIQSYVRRSVSLSQERLRRHVFAPSGKRRQQRHAFVRFQRYIDDYVKGATEKRWVVMSGLRGTGKTTLLAQLFFRQVERGVPVARLPYVSMDELSSLLGFSLREYIDAYERYLGRELETLSKDETVFLFVDEAHFDKDWALALKTVYDRTDRVFIIATGSSSISLQMSPDTVRRADFERLFPLSLPEYLLLKHGKYPKEGVGKALTDAIFRLRSAEAVAEAVGAQRQKIAEYLSDVRPSALDEYLRVGTLPFSIPQSDPEGVYDKVVGMVEKTINEDISMMMGFTKKMRAKMSNLVTLLALSDRMSYPSLCNALGDVTKPTLGRMIHGIERAELVHAVRPFGRPVKKISKTPKYKFTAPSVRAAYLWQIGQLDRREETSGKLLEDAVAMYLLRLSRVNRLLTFDFDATEGGADFIVTMRDGGRLVIEVGYGSKGVAQVERTMERTKARYGILLSSRDFSYLEEKRIVIIPKEWFLLM